MKHIFLLLSLLASVLSGIIHAAPTIPVSTEQNSPDFFHESPARLSQESGLGLIRGWICNPGHIEFQIDNDPRQTISSGLPRGDTKIICGSKNNGYATLINYNLIGVGEHHIRVYADDQLLTEERFTVSGFGQEFLKGFNHSVAVSDFPAVGTDVRLTWSEAHQNFMLRDIIDPLQSKQLARTALKSQNSGETLPDGSSSFALSANGRYVVYDVGHNLQLYDRQTRQTELLLPADFGFPPKLPLPTTFVTENGGKVVLTPSVYNGKPGLRKPAISGNGRFIAFLINTKHDVVVLLPRGLVMARVSSNDIFVLDRETQDISRITVDGATSEKKVSRLNLSISNDGHWVSYKTRVTRDLGLIGNEHLSLHNRETGITKIIASSIRSKGLSLTEKGDILVFDKVVGADENNHNGHKNIFVYTTETEQMRQIELDSLFEPSALAISKNGHWLSFAMRRSSDGNHQAGLHNLATGETTLIPTERSDSPIQHTQVSNEGRYLVYSQQSKRFGGSLGIFRSTYSNIFIYDRQTGLFQPLLSTQTAEKDQTLTRTKGDHSFELSRAGRVLARYGFDFFGTVRTLRTQSVEGLLATPPKLSSFHESPRWSRQSNESGLGLIRGWVCEAETISMQIDDRELVKLPYRIEREDTQILCGDGNNGYAALVNWNLVGSGNHSMRIFADDSLIDDRLFRVTTLGQEFMKGLNRSVQVNDFPFPGDRTTLAWSEPHQNFVITGYIPAIQ